MVIKASAGSQLRERDEKPRYLVVRTCVLVVRREYSRSHDVAIRKIWTISVIVLRIRFYLHRYCPGVIVGSVTTRVRR